ncbi:hypothetical protein [Streptococcus sp. O1]|uniref:hypothetical protein n=1 Tax=Streptococcus sp. O1 TaxID=2928735 RepID=UPI0035902889
MFLQGACDLLLAQEAVDWVVSQGARVQGFISAQTDILIIGHKQLDLFHPEKRSRKYIAALERIAEGQALQLMTEAEFFKLMRENNA